MEIEVHPIQQKDLHDLSIMVGELLNEIMSKAHVPKAFDYSQANTEERARDLLAQGKYWVFIAKDISSDTRVGFVSLCESYALYSEGSYGTIPELFVRPEWRSKSIGEIMVNKIVKFAASKDWKRIEVTTPPLPEFNRTLKFYHANGFEITGGRKLKLDIII